MVREHSRRRRAGSFSTAATIRERFRLPDIRRAAVPARRRSSRTRCRQIRSRYLWRAGRRAGRDLVVHPRCQCLAGRPICGPAGAGARRAGRAVAPEQPSDSDPASRDRPQCDGGRTDRLDRRADSALCHPRGRGFSELLPELSLARDRSRFARASTWSAPATKFSNGADGGSRMSMSNGPIWPLTRSFRNSGRLLGKGYFLPAPVLPRATVANPGAADADGACVKPSFRSPPTSMTRTETRSPRHRFGRLPRAHATALDLDELEGIGAMRDGYGHVELVYDFSAGGEADGWLHALFRYRRPGQRSCR